MSNLKLVKVDNWGIYFLQRLKNFFNRTDYCDLTLQFQDKAQLKVHRLVLSACTEYFEVLERTCEMYEDCLVMPDDLQADVVVPIINFMYTGQLEFSKDLLERLYQTSQIMNMPILTKLLNSHRSSLPIKSHPQVYDFVPKKYSKRVEKPKMKKQVSTPVVPINNKRSYTKAFKKSAFTEDKGIYKPSKNDIGTNDMYFNVLSPINQSNTLKKVARFDPRPTRYELPEELDTDNVFDNSFTNISYTSQPLMVHPETSKRSSHKLNDPTSKKLGKDMSTLDIVDRKKVPSYNIFEDNLSETMNDVEIFSSSYMVSKENSKDPSQLFDQIIEKNEGPKVTIETKNSKMSSNLDHAKIISEVLKKYPHLMKSNKNIKLKILNTPTKVKKESQFEDVQKTLKLKTEKINEDFTYESDFIDSKQAAKLIAMGAENVEGPWICLICGTPDKALHFTSYYKFRRHLVNVHNEKPISNICEYCGLKSLKRNYMMHHLYSQHGVTPPSQYNFPKCNLCNYIALTEGFLVKHKLSHSEPRKFRCNVCVKTYNSSQELLLHIQTTGHKYTPEKKANLQCIYCLKVFLRDYNLYAHLKSHHKQEAKEDEIIEDSDEEKQEEKPKGREKKITIKYEEPVTQPDYELQYEIQENPEGNIKLVSKKQTSISNQKILNPGFTNQKSAPIVVNHQQLSNIDENDEETEDIVMIDNVEYVVRNDQLIARKQNHSPKDDFIISDMLANNTETSLDSIFPTSSMKFTNINNANCEENSQSQRVILNKQSTINHPIQIVVSNEEEYKAIMSANHPIIFDNSDANKTLTVLTAPNNTTLSTTTMNTNNTSSNNMMMIPESYPLNVSNAVAANNSNFVVVYSHPVDSQTKQYQLVTSSQGLETQFVQSPAIITQNFETVTTNTAVMSTHVLDTPESWQNTVHETVIEQEQQAPIVDTQIIEDSADVNINPTDDEHEIHLAELSEVELSQQTSETVAGPLVELPEVQLSQQTSETAAAPFNVDEQTSVNSNQANVCASIEQEVVNEAEPTESLECECGQSVENEINKETKNLSVTEVEQIIGNEHKIKTHMTVPHLEPNIENVSNTEQIEIVHSVENTLPITELEEHFNESTAEQSVLVVEKIQLRQEEQPIEEITYASSPTYTQEEGTTVEEEIITDSNSQDSQDITEKNYPPLVNVTIVETKNKNIDNIASEWSEDEYDVDTEKAAANECQMNVKNHTQNEVAIVETPVELEETIENIKQEVNNTAVSCATREIEKDLNTQNENITKVKQIKSVDKNKMDVNLDVPQNKISSLLNEWEDNDSQEEDTCVTEDDNYSHSEPVENQDIDKPEKCAPADSDMVADSELQEAKAPEDNIKSLVSDWDDDE